AAQKPSRKECVVDFRIDPEACVACLACVRVCPSDAIAVENEKVWIVDESCTRVGLCLPACPHEAIIAVGDSTRALEYSLSRDAVLILSVESAVWFYPATPEQVEIGRASCRERVEVSVGGGAVRKERRVRARA